ncbi:Hypothetical predicted protein [Podarcis lilfordi]|uniref:UPAR/Ly6 domain-containing protein n=1 Tax=Podarcis lilfordi TaxID=74358 RepID=A0AA35LHB7_9SAUR|nr:Hypothetical predicted protein [Podarcis lilfordi]
MKLLPSSGIWILLCFCTANATWCFQCIQPRKTGNCPAKKELCWAGGEAACYTLNLYISKTLIATVVGCLQQCEGYRFYGPYTWHEIICCSTDYCNM